MSCAVQIQGCGCLWNMAVTDASRAQIIRLDGLVVIRQARTTWQGDAELQAVGEAATRALQLAEPSALSQSVRA